MDIIKGTNGQKSVLDTAREAGIEQPLVDAAILDVSDPGPASKFIFQVKSDFGLPTGCAAHNAISLYKTRKKFDSATTKFSLTAVANVFPIIMGANFAFLWPH